MKTVPLFVWMVFWWAPDSNSQTLSNHVVATAGFSTSDAGNGMDFTIGDLAVTTVGSGPAFVSQGFHQTYVERVSILETEEVTLTIHVFPNPTTDYVTIEINGDKIRDITAVVYDGSGKVVYTGTYPKAKIFQIDMSRWAAGQYYIRLTDGFTRTPIKTLGIQKQIHQ